MDILTKMLGWLVGARDGKKLRSSWDPVNSIPTEPFKLFLPWRCMSLVLLTFIITNPANI